jgi:hypothetical protein
MGLRIGHWDKALGFGIGSLPSRLIPINYGGQHLAGRHYGIRASQASRRSVISLISHLRRTSADAPAAPRPPRSPYTCATPFPYTHPLHPSPAPMLLHPDYNIIERPASAPPTPLCCPASCYTRTNHPEEDNHGGTVERWNNHGGIEISTRRQQNRSGAV